MPGKSRAVAKTNRKTMAVGLAALGLVLAVGGISAGAASASSAAATPSTPAPSLAALAAFPIDAYTGGAQAQSAFDVKLQSAIDSCMASRGYAVPKPAVPESTLTAEITARRYGIESLDVAQVDGYHLPSLVNNTRSNSAPAMSDAANDSFYGAGKYANQGCSTQAWAAVGPYPATAAAEKISAGGFTASQSTPAVTSATAAWSACMTAHGYHYSSPLKSIADPKWNTPAPTRTEIATAVTDVNCSATTKLASEWHSAESAMQSNSIAKSDRAVLSAAGSSALPAVGIMPAAAGPIYVGNVGRYPNNVKVTFCTRGLYCFYYNSGWGGAYWFAPGCDLPNLAGYVFNRHTAVYDGYNTHVINNAASAANGSYFTMLVFYNQNYSGSYDVLPTNTMATTLQYTFNNNASLYGNC